MINQFVSALRQEPMWRAVTAAGTRRESPLVLSPDKAKARAVSACHRFLAALGDIPVAGVGVRTKHSHAHATGTRLKAAATPWHGGWAKCLTVLLMLAAPSRSLAQDICTDSTACRPGTPSKFWTTAAAFVTPTDFDLRCFHCAASQFPGVAASTCQQTAESGTSSSSAECLYPLTRQLHVSAGGAYDHNPVGSATGSATAGLQTRLVFHKPGASGPIAVTIRYRLVITRSGSIVNVYLRTLFANGNNFGCAAVGLPISGNYDFAAPITGEFWDVPMDYAVAISMSNGGNSACGGACSASADLVYELTGITVTAAGVPVSGFAVTDFYTGQQVWPCRNVACPGDTNCSGTLSVQDIFDFLAGYFSGDPRADFNGSGVISVQDIFDFLAAYFAGCN